MINVKEEPGPTLYPVCASGAPRSLAWAYNYISVGILLVNSREISILWRRATVILKSYHRIPLRSLLSISGAIKAKIILRFVALEIRCWHRPSSSMQVLHKRSSFGLCVRIFHCRKCFTCMRIFRLLLSFKILHQISEKDCFSTTS